MTKPVFLPKNISNTEKHHAEILAKRLSLWNLSYRTTYPANTTLLLINWMVMTKNGTISPNKRTVSYSNLPQGTYRFMVKAANNDGKWNSTPTILEIVVLPVWYKHGGPSSSSLLLSLVSSLLYSAFSGCVKAWKPNLR